MLRILLNGQNNFLLCFKAQLLEKPREKHSHSTHVTFDKIAVKPHLIKSRFVKSFKDPRRFAKSVTLKRCG